MFYCFFWVIPRRLNLFPLLYWNVRKQTFLTIASMFLLGFVDRESRYIRVKKNQLDANL